MLEVGPVHQCNIISGPAEETAIRVPKPREPTCSMGIDLSRKLPGIVTENGASIREARATAPFRNCNGREIY
jgi:hypothetical protein